MKNILRIFITVCLEFGAGMGVAQQTAQSITPPVLTFVPDNTGGLRPVLGIAASASVGGALDLGFGITQAAIPPEHDYVLATTAQNNWPVLLQVHGNSATARSMDSFVTQRDKAPAAECGLDQTDLPWGQRASGCAQGAVPMNGLSKVDRIALSPTGSAAAFFSKSEGRIYAFSNLSQSPVPLGAFDIATLGALSAFGISDDGRTVAAGFSDGVTGSLFLLSVNEAPRLIASMGHPSAIQFRRNSDAAIIADDVDNKIYALSSGQVFAIATANDGISAPAGIAVSNDNQKIFIGNSQPGSVSTIGPYGSVAEPMVCNCTLTGLYPTKTDSVFRLNDFSGRPVLLFDGSSRVPRMIFVSVGSH